MFNFKKKKKETPEDISELITRFKELEEKNKELQAKVEEIYERQDNFLQHIGVVRFNPFSDEGGNQSFSIAILDNNGNGVVVTSLYSKEGNRVYAKPVEGGISKYSLSKEEEKAMQNYGKET